MILLSRPVGMNIKHIGTLEYLKMLQKKCEIVCCLAECHFMENFKIFGDVDGFSYFMKFPLVFHHIELDTILNILHIS